jgi:hypothetical protein
MAKRKSKITKVPVEIWPDDHKEYITYTNLDQGDSITLGRWQFATKSTVPVTETWEDAEPFYAELKICGSHRGRSAAQVLVEDQAGNVYTMFMQGFLNALIQGGKYPLVGSFEFVKKGANYAIEMVQNG